MKAQKTKLSAGVLVYRARDGVVEVLLAHPGGPFWARKDDGVWSIPKGEHTDDEDPWAAARREFSEELGLPVPAGPRIELGALKQPSGKVVTAFAVKGDLDVTDAHSNTFEMEWPRGSGTMREFPEVDRVGWFAVAQARTKLLKGQRGFLDRLMTHPELAGLSEGT
ncbi:NUDIX domain-containing protein [Mycobacterium malmoense]|uniref:NTP pyrophosphohydrolase n=1 Tax=Mycobacterium malmoense TaxID=1780 RepID=A0ABX3STM3_MYCMA|nr:NUDIX domain-containing protein [Mycobacterium malmoense]OIN78227.1 NTP pyrophosphohydrolase [Mycobacterium malmoense]ORA83863.1 NTP pyrophosphohydrolase [Mycobacterium malmoense]QZA17510.1 NUDIX domain-containing protein [Mycobacterium malmoense]UNB94295.1 NUDIX domain-containing protein [Mycobacterium malmoense]